MTSSSNSARDPVILSVPEIRDYEKINAEIIQRLDSGATRIRLAGVERQRFLVAGLTGTWRAVIEVEGWAGPELAASLNAPGLTVVCHGPALDGAGRGLTEGRLVILGPAGDGLAYSQSGGSILAASGAGARAGLNQQGGVLAILGAVGRLAGERQVGGRIFLDRDRCGPYVGRGRRGGRLILWSAPAGRAGELDTQDLEVFRSLLADTVAWTGLEPVPPG